MAPLANLIGGAGILVALSVAGVGAQRTLDGTMPGTVTTYTADVIDLLARFRGTIKAAPSPRVPLERAIPDVRALIRAVDGLRDPAAPVWAQVERASRDAVAFQQLRLVVERQKAFAERMCTMLESGEHSRYRDSPGTSDAILAVYAQQVVETRQDVLDAKQALARLKQGSELGLLTYVLQIDGLIDDVNARVRPIADQIAWFERLIYLSAGFEGVATASASYLRTARAALPPDAQRDQSYRDLETLIVAARKEISSALISTRAVDYQAMTRSGDYPELFDGSLFRRWATELADLQKNRDRVQSALDQARSLAGATFGREPDAAIDRAERCVEAARASAAAPPVTAPPPTPASGPPPGTRPGAPPVTTPLVTPPEKPPVDPPPVAPSKPPLDTPPVTPPVAQVPPPNVLPTKPLIEPRSTSAATSEAARRSSSADNCKPTAEDARCVPDLIDKPLDEAARILEGLGLIPAIIIGPEAPPSASRRASKEGTIRHQVPWAGMEAIVGSEVSIEVWSTPTVEVKVPLIRGMTEDQARAALAQVKLHLDIRDGDQSPLNSDAVGTIYHQYPDTGQGITVPEGTGILGVRYATERRFAKDWNLDSQGPETISIVPPGSTFKVGSAVVGIALPFMPARRLIASDNPRSDNRPVETKGTTIVRPEAGWQSTRFKRAVTVGLRYPYLSRYGYGELHDEAHLRIVWESPMPRVPDGPLRDGCAGKPLIGDGLARRGSLPAHEVTPGVFLPPVQYSTIELQGTSNEVVVDFIVPNRQADDWRPRRDEIVRLLEHVVRQIEPFGKPCKPR